MNNLKDIRSIKIVTFCFIKFYLVLLVYTVCNFVDNSTKKNRHRFQTLFHIYINEVKLIRSVKSGSV